MADHQNGANFIETFTYKKYPPLEFKANHPTNKQIKTYDKFERKIWLSYFRNGIFKKSLKVMYGKNTKNCIKKIIRDNKPNLLYKIIKNTFIDLSKIFDKDFIVNEVVHKPMKRMVGLLMNQDISEKDNSSTTDTDTEAESVVKATPPPPPPPVCRDFLLNLINDINNKDVIRWIDKDEQIFKIIKEEVFNTLIFKEIPMEVWAEFTQKNFKIHPFNFIQLLPVS